MKKNKTLQIDKEAARKCVKEINNLHSKIFHLDSLFWAIKNLNWEELQEPRNNEEVNIFSLTMLGELGYKISTECMDSVCFLNHTIKEKLEKITGKKGDADNE